MEPTPAIRRLAPGEWRAYRELRLRSLADSPDAFATTLAEARARDGARWEREAAAGAGSPRQIVLVAESGARLVGLASSRLDEAEPARVRLYQMWVDPDFRRRGTGRRLLETSLRWAASAGAREVVLSVAVARGAATRLYESAGFEPCGPPEPLRAGSELRVQPMALDLRAR